MVLGLGQGTRDEPLLAPRPLPFRVEEPALVDPTRFPTSPCTGEAATAPVFTASHTSQLSRPLLATIQPIRQRPFGVQLARASSTGSGKG